MGARQETLEQTVLKIFVDHSAGRGDRLLLNDLKAEWARQTGTGEELIETVRRMIFDGTLDLAHTPAGTALALTVYGLQRTGAMRNELRGIWNHMVAACSAPLPPSNRQAILTG